MLWWWKLCVATVLLSETEQSKQIRAKQNTGSQRAVPGAAIAVLPQLQQKLYLYVSFKSL